MRVKREIIPACHRHAEQPQPIAEKCKKDKFDKRTDTTPKCCGSFLPNLIPFVARSNCVGLCLFAGGLLSCNRSNISYLSPSIISVLIKNSVGATKRAGLQHFGTIVINVYRANLLHKFVLLAPSNHIYVVKRAILPSELRRSQEQRLYDGSSCIVVLLKPDC